MSIVEKFFRKHFGRVIAFWIDWFIVLLPNVTIGILLETFYKEESINDLFFGLGLGFIYLIYFTYFSVKYGQTIGKKLVKLKIVTIGENHSINLKSAIYRHIPFSLFFTFAAIAEPEIDPTPSLNPMYVCEKVCMLWLLSEVAFYLIKNNGQMLHDYIAKTTVIKYS